MGNNSGDAGDDSGDAGGGSAAPAPAASQPIRKEPTAEEVQALLAQTAAQVEEDKRLAELKALEEAEKQRAAEAAAAAEREAAERAQQAKEARNRFRSQLRAAMDMHEKKRFAAAVELYADGLEALGEAYRLETDAAQKEDLRLQFERYIRVAESAKASQKALEEANEPK